MYFDEDELYVHITHIQLIAGSADVIFLPYTVNCLHFERCTEMTLSTKILPTIVYPHLPLPLSSRNFARLPLFSSSPDIPSLPIFFAIFPPVSSLEIVRATLP